jgi:DNA polymerase elongation subunit (family B)
MKELVSNAFLGEEYDELKIVSAIDQFCEQKIQPYIDNCYQGLAVYMNAYQQKMQMKRETIANKGIWRKKKMYILNAWNVEGVQYEHPKLKIHGIEAVRSDKPHIVREYLKKSFDIIMNKDENELIKLVNDFHDKFITLPFDEVAFPRGVNGLSEYFMSNKSVLDGSIEDGYKDRTPIHVKGALTFNKMLKNLNIKTIPPISEGDKIKFAYLKLPNPTHETVIAVPDILPDELNYIDKYVDREMQFKRHFLNHYSL